MLLLIFSWYGLFTSPGTEKPIYLYKIWGSSRCDTINFKGGLRENLFGNFFYQGDGKFTFISSDENYEYVYLYSIPDKKLKIMIKFRITQKQSKEVPFTPEYIKIGKLGNRLSLNNCVVVNDTLILLSVSNTYNYILHFNPERDSVLDIVDAPPSYLRFRFESYNNKNKLVIISTEAPGADSPDLVCNYVYNIKNTKYKKINQGYIYPEMWVNDYRLLVSDLTEYNEAIQNEGKYNKPPWHYYIIDIKTGKRVLVKDNIEGKWAYYNDGELQVLDCRIITNASAKIRLRDKEGNIIKEKIVPKSRYYYGKRYFIPYPEDTVQ